MTKKQKKIISFLLTITTLLSLQGCAGSDTFDQATNTTGELLKGEATIYETTQIPTLDITQPINLFKETDTVLNQFYYGLQVPIFRFSAKSSAKTIDTYIKKLIFKIEITGDIDIANYKLYDLETSQLPLPATPTELTRANLLTLSDIQNVKILPKDNITGRTFELRADITKKEGNSTIEPQITISVQNSTASLQK